MKIISSLFFLEANDIEQIRQLTCSSIKDRVRLFLQTNDFFTFILDGVLGLQINKSIFSRKFIQQPSLSANDLKVEHVISNTLHQRAEIYSHPTSYTCKFFLEDRFLLSPLEREFFLTQKLQKWLGVQLRSRRKTTEQKQKWLYKVNDPTNNLNITFAVSFDFNNPVLYYLQTLYKTYLLEEEIYSVAHALDRLNLPGGELFIHLYESEVILDPAYTASALDREIDFRVQFLKNAYFCLEQQRLPENIQELDNAFDDFYQNAVRWTLVATIKHNPDLTDLFSQIPDESPFWEETQINKNWWDFIVKTLDLPISVYTFPSDQQSSEQQHYWDHNTSSIG